MNSGPSAGVRYKVDRKAIIDSPKDVNRAGRAGTGSMRGRNMNHAAQGTRVASPKVDSKGLGCKASMFYPFPTTANTRFEILLDEDRYSAKEFC